MSWHTEEGGVMCFSPSREQFRDFSGFISFMESKGAHKCGVAKVRAVRSVDDRAPTMDGES